MPDRIRSAGADRVRKHRDKMKAAGLKPVTIWVPDTQTPAFKAQVTKAVAAINASEDEKILFKELEAALEDIEGWT